MSFEARHDHFPKLVRGLCLKVNCQSSLVHTSARWFCCEASSTKTRSSAVFHPLKFLSVQKRTPRAIENYFKLIIFLEARWSTRHNVPIRTKHRMSHSASFFVGIASCRPELAWKIRIADESSTLTNLLHHTGQTIQASGGSHRKQKAALPQPFRDRRKRLCDESRACTLSNPFNIERLTFSENKFPSFSVVDVFQSECVCARQSFAIATITSTVPMDFRFMTVWEKFPQEFFLQSNLNSFANSIENCSSIGVLRSIIIEQT